MAVRLLGAVFEVRVEGGRSMQKAVVPIWRGFEALLEVTPAFRSWDKLRESARYLQSWSGDLSLLAFQEAACNFL